MLLKISQNSQENTYARASFFVNMQSCMSATLSKKRLWHKYSSVNFAKFLRTLFLRNTSRRPLLKPLKLCWCGNYYFEPFSKIASLFLLLNLDRFFLGDKILELTNLTFQVPTPQNGQTQTIRQQQPTNCFSVFDHLWFCGAGA